MKNNIWKDILEYEGLYQINNFGEIINVKRNTKITPYIDKYGYLRVLLSKNGKKKNYCVHRLVAKTFLDWHNFKYTNKDLNNVFSKETLEINHKDENKQNNCIDNLEWCTPSYNCSYGERTKKIAEKMKIINKGKHYSPKTEFKKGYGAMKVKNITTNKIYNSMAEASIDTDVEASNISMCCSGKIKKAGGYEWVKI